MGTPSSRRRTDLLDAGTDNPPRVCFRIP
jgi:hypothetical protein